MDESVKVLTGDVPPDSGQVNPAVNPPGTETLLAEVLAELLGHDRVSVQSNFFDDLGAKFVGDGAVLRTVRKRQPDLPPVSMKSIYHYPTIQSLAAALALPAPPHRPVRRKPRQARGVIRPSPRPAGLLAQESVDSAMPARSCSVCLVRGTLQLLIFLAYSYLAEVVAISGYRWISADPGLVDVYLRSVAFGGVAFVAQSDVPDRGEVDPDRPVEAPRVPRLGPDLPALLDRQGARARQPDDLLRRQSVVRAVPARPRREDRPERHDPVPAHAGVHRPAHHRRRDGDPQGLVLPAATGRTPAGSRPARSRSAGTCTSASGPCSTSTRRWATERNSATPRPCTAATRYRTATGGTDPRHSAPT